MKVLVRGSVAKVTDGNVETLNRILRCANPRFRWERRTNPMAEKYVTFYNGDTKTFPAGLVDFAKTTLRKRGLDLDATYRTSGQRMTVDPACLLGRTLRDYQVASTKIGLLLRRGVLELATGGGKTSVMAAIIHYLTLEDLGPALIIVPSKHLLHQTADELAKMLGCEVGRIGDGKKQLNCAVTVATPDTLRQGIDRPPEWNRKFRKAMGGGPANPAMAAFLKSVKVLLLDEAHHGSSESWFKIAMQCPAEVRLAFTGTADKKDKLSWFRLMAATGPILKRITSKELIDRGVLAVPTVYYVKDRDVFGPMVPSHVEGGPKNYFGTPAPRPWNEIYKDAIVDNNEYNGNIALIAKKMIAMGHPPVVLATQVRHVQNIMKHMKRRDVPCYALMGKDSVERRNSVLQKFVEGQDCCIVLTGIIDEGVDVPDINGIMLVGGGKSRVKFIQRIGRGLRKKKDNKVIVVDFAHRNNFITNRHAKERRAECKRQGWKVVGIAELTGWLNKAPMLR